mmetsp:Transcript_1506/g.3158  ORF Transcript_1506/g.3158 Transcript_1506/m.3158 type:complete len:121 (-) Transcript_1506:1306-1668(-)
MRRCGSHPFTMEQSVSPQGASSLSGEFWNYFSIGMDAAAARGFLSWRERFPWTTGGLCLNALWYTLFACLNGGWCFDGVVPALQPFLTLRVRASPAAAWSQVEVPPGVRALVLVNLGSYG